MADVHKSYYAIIPANIRYDSSITPNAKLLYGEITALCNEKGYCWANNEYFASLYEVSKVSISKWIRQLVEKGYIDSVLEYKEGTKEILNRYLTIVNDPIKEKFNTPIKEKFKDNNTLINNTSNNKKEKRKTEFDLLIEGYTEDLQLRNTIYEFLKMRKAIKAPMTSNALKLMLNKLDRLAPKDIHCDLRIAILEQSIMNSWKGIFELKEELKKKVVPEDRHYGFNG